MDSSPQLTPASDSIEHLNTIKARIESLSTTGPEEELISVLQEAKGLKVTLETLSTTQIGLTINSKTLKKHPSAAVRTLAAEVVAIYKASALKPSAVQVKKEVAVKQEKKETSTTTTTTTTTATVKVEIKKESTSTSSTTTVSASKFISLEKPELDVKDEEGKTESVGEKRKREDIEEEDIPLEPLPLGTLAKTGVQTRDSVRSKLCEVLGFRYSESDLDPAAVAVEIEDMMHQYFVNEKRSDKQYQDRFRTLMFNIKKNPELRESILTGVATFQEIAYEKPAKDLASLEEQEKRKKLLEYKKQERFMQWGKKQANTDQFKCGRCKSRDCEYTQMQTRSADEPMTVFVTCLNCGKRWKF